MVKKLNKEVQFFNLSLFNKLSTCKNAVFISLKSDQDIKLVESWRYVNCSRKLLWELDLIT